MQLHAQLSWHARLGLECPIVHFKSGLAFFARVFLCPFWPFMAVWAYYGRVGLLWPCGPIMRVGLLWPCGPIMPVLAFYGRVGVVCLCWPIMPVWASMHGWAYYARVGLLCPYGPIMSV